MDILVLRLALMFCLTMLAPAFVVADTAEPVGKITFTHGESYIFHAGERKKAEVNMPVYAGDTALTLDDGRIKLRMIDDSLVYIARGSRIIIKEYKTKDSRLETGMFEMLWGKTRFMVNKLMGDAKFQTRTKTAVMGVRGTQYIVMVPRALVNSEQLASILNDPNLTLDDVLAAITRLIVLEGQVRGTNISGDSRDVNAGNTANFFVNGVIKVKPTEALDGENMPTAGVQTTETGSSPVGSTFESFDTGQPQGVQLSLPAPGANRQFSRTNASVAGTATAASAQAITQTVTQATGQGATTITIAPTFVP